MELICMCDVHLFPKLVFDIKDMVEIIENMKAEISAEDAHFFYVLEKQFSEENKKEE
jgi:hypothetical protein